MNASSEARHKRMVKGGLLAHVALCNQYAIVAGAHIVLRYSFLCFATAFADGNYIMGYVRES